MPRPPTIPVRKSQPIKKAALQPHSEVAALFKQGLALLQQGQLGKARQIYEKVLAKQPTNFDALHLSGLIAAESRNPTLAVELIGKAIEINPKNPEAHFNLGNSLKELKRVEEAIASFDRAIAIKPDHADAYSNRGNALKELKRVEEAIASYDKAIAIKPDYADAHYNRGVGLKELKRVEEAIVSYDKAIAIKPDHADAYSNRGNALKELKRAEEAITSFDKAIAIKPDFAEAYSHRGVALKALKRVEEAIASYDKAIAIKPDHADAYSNRGNALKALNRVEEAIASYDKAIAIKPDFAEAYWNKSLAFLVAGEFAQGWELYEWRWKTEDTGKNKRNFLQPLWLGAEDIAGKTILLHAEQGLGDTLQFCRYAKLVKERGARVALEMPKALLGLLSGLEGVDVLVENGKALPAFDYHCPLMSLPLAFKTSLTCIPSPKSYLSAAPEKCEEWAQRLGVKGKPRVGLAWSGSKVHKNDNNRSLTLKQLLPHLPDCCEYVSLQKEVREVDLQVLEGSGIRHYEQELKDFTDTAALCELMDLVISVDTSVAHLAGALGKTTWVLLPYAPDWRWLLDRDDSPWYESVKLYRQDESREWSSTLMEVEQSLRGYESKEEQLLSTSIPILVLNLVRSKERRVSFREFNKHLTYEYFNAIDGRDLTIEQIRASGLFEENLPFPSLGAYGCALSHLKLWEISIDKNFPITVAEDDAIFRHDFLVQSNKVISTLPSDWDFILWGWNFDSVLSVNLLPAPIVMLSNQELMRKNAEVFQNQRSPSLPLALDKCFGIPAYTISPKGANRFKNLCYPMENFELKFPVLKNKMPTTGIDLAMARFFSTTKSFVSFPPLVITKNEHSISTIQKNS